MIACLSAPPHIDTAALAKRLGAEHKMTLAPDPTRALVNAYGFQTIYDMPRDLQTATRRKLINEHGAAVKGAKDTLFECGVFPWIADWMRWHWNGTPAEAWIELWTQVGAIAKGYDRIYHVAEGPTRAYDGYAWLDKRNAHQIEPLLRFAYQELGVADKVQTVKL